MKNLIITAFLAASAAFSAFSADIRYVGGDISLYPTYEEAGAKYKDENGNNISLLPYLHEIGMNAMRVRLFVDPDGFAALHPNDYDENACQDLPYIIPLCQQIIENGFELMLDFHYSDTWADPGAQWIPQAWEGLSDSELEEAVYEYTIETLQTLKKNGITPKFIQPGNEISYGMLWAEFGNDVPGNHVYVNSNDKTWQRFGNFLNSAIKACREECPDAEIIIHTERASQVNVLTNFYDKMASLDIDYDIIGLSYYPYFHGNMSVLNTALTSLERRYPDKPIMIVETGFPYKWAVPGSDPEYNHDFTLEDQNEFAKSLVDTLLDHPNVNGLFWWWLEYNAYGTQLSGWYNAPLFDSSNGRATPALKTIAGFGTDNAAVNSIMADPLGHNDTWYDLNGRSIALPSQTGIYIHDGKKVVIK